MSLMMLRNSWIQSTTFASYMLSRVIGGLSEGNVQLAMYVHVHLKHLFTHQTSFKLLLMRI